MQDMQERLWLTKTVAYQEGDEDLMTQMMDMLRERCVLAVQDICPDMKLETPIYAEQEGALEGSITLSVYTSKKDRKEKGFVSLTCAAIPIKRNVHDGRHLWQISCEDIIRCSEKAARVYLCRKAVAAAMQLAPYIKDECGDLHGLGHTKRPEDVKAGKDDVLTARLYIPGGETLDLTARPYGDDARRLTLIRQTKDIRQFINKYPDLPIIVASDVHLPEDTLNSCCLPVVSCRKDWILDYDYLGDGTLITDPVHLDMCLEADLAEKYGDNKEAFERAFFVEKEKLTLYWREAIVIEAGR